MKTQTFIAIKYLIHATFLVSQKELYILYNLGRRLLFLSHLWLFKLLFLDKSYDPFFRGFIRKEISLIKRKRLLFLKEKAIPIKKLYAHG